MVHESLCWLYQEMGQLKKVISGSLLRRRHENIYADFPRYKAEERRVDQDICGEISEYDAPMSKRHDLVYVGRDLPLHPANCTTGSDRSS